MTQREIRASTLPIGNGLTGGPAPASPMGSCFRGEICSADVIAVATLGGQGVFMTRLLTRIGISILLFAPLLFAPAAARAQILVAGDGPVVYGHHHLNTTNMAAQKKFYADTLGGVVETIGSGDRHQEIIQFPNVL